MPSQGVAVDGESGIFGIGNKLLHAGEIHISAAIDNRCVLHCVAGHNLVEMSCHGVAHVLGVVVELGNIERAAELKVGVLGTVDVCFQIT